MAAKSSTTHHNLTARPWNLQLSFSKQHRITSHKSQHFSIQSVHICCILAAAPKHRRAFHHLRLHRPRASLICAGAAMCSTKTVPSRASYRRTHPVHCTVLLPLPPPLHLCPISAGLTQHLDHHCRSSSIITKSIPTLTTSLHSPQQASPCLHPQNSPLLHHREQSSPIHNSIIIINNHNPYLQSAPAAAVTTHQQSPCCSSSAAKTQGAKPPQAKQTTTAQTQHRRALRPLLGLSSSTVFFCADPHLLLRRHLWPCHACNHLGASLPPQSSAPPPNSICPCTASAPLTQEPHLASARFRSPLHHLEFYPTAGSSSPRPRDLSPVLKLLPRPRSPISAVTIHPSSLQPPHRASDHTHNLQQLINPCSCSPCCNLQPALSLSHGMKTDGKEARKGCCGSEEEGRKLRV